MDPEDCNTPPSSPRKPPVCPDAPKKANVVPESTYRSWQHFSRKVAWQYYFSRKSANE